MEVPTIVSYSSLQQRSAEQIVDIPVARSRGRRRQSSLPGQASTASATWWVRQWRSSRFTPRQSSAAVDAEQIVDIPVPGGGLYVPLPDPGASDSSAVLPDELDQWVFSTSRVKKVRARVRGCTGTQARGANPSTGTDVHAKRSGPHPRASRLSGSARSLQKGRGSVLAHGNACQYW